MNIDKAPRIYIVYYILSCILSLLLSLTILKNISEETRSGLVCMSSYFVGLFLLNLLLFYIVLDTKNINTSSGKKVDSLFIVKNSPQFNALIGIIAFVNLVFGIIFATKLITENRGNVLWIYIIAMLVAITASFYALMVGRV